MKKITKNNNQYIRNIAIKIKLIWDIIRSNKKLNNDTYINTIKNIFSKEYIQYLNFLVFKKKNLNITNVEYGDIYIYENTMHEIKNQIDNILNKLKVTIFGHIKIDDLLVQINYELLMYKVIIINICKLINKWFMNNNYRSIKEVELSNIMYDIELLHIK